MLCLPRRAADVGRSLVLPHPRGAAPDRADARGLTPDRLAVEMLRHLNAGDLDGFRGVVSPEVRITAAPSGTGVVLAARDLFTRLAGLGPQQTLCAARVRATDTGARIDLELAWRSPSGACASSLGTLDVRCAGERVTDLVLDLDVDPALERAAMAALARPVSACSPG